MTEKKKALLISVFCLFPVLSVFAQQVKISVRLGNEPAEYAYVKANSRYVGQCDENGICRVDATALRDGDKLTAEYAGLRSSTTSFRRGTSTYRLTLGSSELTPSNVEGKEIHLLREYIRRMNRIKIRYINFGQKYGLPYHFSTLARGEEEAVVREGRYDLSLIHGHDVTDEDDFWDTYGLQVDTMVVAELASTLLYAKELISLISDEYALEDELGKRELLIHKVVSEEEELCYIFIEGRNRNNQTVIHMDASGRDLLRISRAFVGSGSVVLAAQDSYHEMDIRMVKKDKTCIGQVSFNISSPSPDRVYTHVELLDVEVVPMYKTEVNRVMELMHSPLRIRKGIVR